MQQMGIMSDAWRFQPVDPKIWPLVDRMNQSGQIQTIASCEGHFWRTSDPYVYFSCAPAVAETLAGRLDALKRDGLLYHHWGLEGVFDPGHRLGFVLRSGSLSHDNGVLTSFWRYVVKRSWIDHDLDVLATHLPEVLEHAKQASQLAGEVEPNNQCDNNQNARRYPQPHAPQPFTEGICSLALRATARMVRSDIRSANPTSNKFRHHPPIFINNHKHGIAPCGGSDKC